MDPKRRKAQGGIETDHDSKPLQSPYLARIPSELLQEILSYFRTLPLSFNAEEKPTAVKDPTDDSWDFVVNRYSERTNALRALSQTCRALHIIMRPLLWSTITACVVPKHAIGIYYKLVMQDLKRKTDGVRKSRDIPAFVQRITFMITKSGLEDTLSSLTALLKMPALSNLRVIQVLSCNSAGALSAALSGLSLPTVRTVAVTTSAHGVLHVCPNATDVRCVGGVGKELIGALELCKCESFEGFVDWTVPNLMDRFVENVPALRKFEMRQMMRCGIGASDTTMWASNIAKLSKLAHLTVIQLTFSRQEVEPLESDKAAITAARRTLLSMPTQCTKQLRIKRFISPSYDNGLEEEEVLDWHVEDLI